MTTSEPYVLNIGPQHPSTHGVFRIRVVMDGEKIQDIDWVDITDNDFAKKETSKNSKELLRRLHIKENGKIIQGAEAFLYVFATYS